MQMICHIHVKNVKEDSEHYVDQLNMPDIAEYSNILYQMMNHLIQAERFYWGEEKGSQITKDIGECYDKIVYWRRNLFMLPNGGAGKNYIREMTRLLNSWNEDSPLKDIAMKAIHIMPALLLQKPSKTSKSKDHLKALERRLEVWNKGDITALFREAETLQQRLPKPQEKSDIASISRRFKNLMESGNVNGAIKLITNNMGGGILPLDDETLETLHQKHPEGKEADENIMLTGPIQHVDPILYEAIDETLVLKAAQRTKGGSGPSGLDADGWRKP